MKAHYLYQAGKLLSLTALLCLPIKMVAAQDEFDEHREQTNKEFREFKEGKRKPVAPASAAEVKPAEVQPVEVKPVVAQPKAEPVKESVATGGNAGQVISDCRECPEMVVIPAGSFNMGSNDYAPEKPVHHVTFAHAFAIGKTEVTQGQWAAVMGHNPAYSPQGPNFPVQGVSWRDAQDFIKKLNQKTGKQYRLPSEAEWEYTCRAGGAHKYCGSDDGESVAWYDANSNNRHHPVAQNKANAFGLYDMSGNVSEWVEDRYHENYEGAPTDGGVWADNDAERVYRGGSFAQDTSALRATDRLSKEPGERDRSRGFRLVRMLP